MTGAARLIPRHGQKNFRLKQSHKVSLGNFGLKLSQQNQSSYPSRTSPPGHIRVIHATEVDADI